MNIEEIKDFYEDTWKKGQDILRMILDDKDQYIKMKAENEKWSELTLEMSIMNNQAFRLYSIMKHTFVSETPNQTNSTSLAESKEGQSQSE